MNAPLTPASASGAGEAPAESAVALGACPKVSPKFRLQWEEAQQSWVLLYPEGMVKLNRSAGEILSRCDGQRSLAAIIAELEAAFSTAGLETDVLAFVELAQRQQWLRS